LILSIRIEDISEREGSEDDIEILSPEKAIVNFEFPLTSKGLTWHIRVSNFSIEMLGRMQLSPCVTVQLFVIQVEQSLYCQQQAMLRDLEALGIRLTSWSQLCNARTARSALPCSRIQFWWQWKSGNTGAARDQVLIGAATVHRCDPEEPEAGENQRQRQLHEIRTEPESGHEARENERRVSNRQRCQPLRRGHLVA
jgi:hypothetical protein